METTGTNKHTDPTEDSSARIQQEDVHNAGANDPAFDHDQAGPVVGADATGTITSDSTSDDAPVAFDGVEGYFDFDGVFNAFPDPKVWRRGGQDRLDWLPVDDLRRELYDPDGNAFLLNGNTKLKVPEGNYRVHWSNELAGRLHLLMESGVLRLHWLTTWQPYTSMLDKILGFDDMETVTERWYDESTRRGIWTGKQDTVVARINTAYKTGSPLSLIWVDDEECNSIALKAVKAALDAHEDDGSVHVLMVRPDDRIGVSRRQLDEILGFVKDPSSYGRLSYDIEPSIDDPYDEMKRGHLGF